MVEYKRVNEGGEQSLGGGVMTPHGHYVDDVRVCVIL